MTAPTPAAPEHSESRPVLLIVVASTRPGRIGIHFARWFEQQALDHAGFDVRFADLAEVNLPFFDEPKHPRFGQYEHQHTKDWSATVGSADAVVLVTPEYNHGYNAVLKNAIDYLHNEWADTPIGFVSYGGVASGTRAVQQLKQVFAALRTVTVVEAVNIPFAPQFLGEGGVVNANDIMLSSAKAMLDELARVTAQLHP
jgi:NAD(P)H-dependent FMN reductase